MGALAFDAFQKLDLPLGEIVAGPAGFVHDIFSVFPYELQQALPDEDRDLVVLLPGRNQDEGFQRLAAYPGRVVAVFGAGDRSIDADLLASMGRRLPANVVAVYGLNMELEDPRAVAVPMGVRSTKLRQLAFVRRNCRPVRNRCAHGSFRTIDVRDYRNRDLPPHVRKSLARQAVRTKLAADFRNVPWVALDVFQGTRSGQAQLLDYYTQIAGHRFVLSPPGFGADCFRHWESLYLGAVPIVQRSRAMSAFADLPILFTEDYTELSEDYLEQRWQEMSCRSYDLTKLMKSHYLRLFLSSVSCLSDPGFICLQSGRFPREPIRHALARRARPPSELPGEPPSPPFGARGLMDASAWEIQGGLRVEQDQDEVLKVMSSNRGVGGAIMCTLETIAGGRFVLAGSIEQHRQSGEALKMTVGDGDNELVSVVVTGERKEFLNLRFRARSDRTILSMSIADGPVESGVFVRRLSLEAEV